MNERLRQEGPEQGIPTERERLSTFDLLIMAACFDKHVNNIFKIKKELI